MGKPTYTPEFVATFGISRTAAYREIRDGRLKASKDGRRVVIRVADSEAWLRESPRGVYFPGVRPALHTVVEMPEYLSRAEGLLSEAERIAIVDWLAANPTAGDLIVGTGGARKLRWAAKGKGKSGGVPRDYLFRRAATAGVPAFRFRQGTEG